MRGARGLPDADAILARMRADTAHGWPRRLAAVVGIGLPLRPSSAITDASGAPCLTYAEARVLQLLAHGLTVPMAAELLALSPQTIRYQLASARRRLAAKNSTHAVAIAIRRGVIR